MNLFDLCRKVEKEFLSGTGNGDTVMGLMFILVCQPVCIASHKKATELPSPSPRFPRRECR